MRKHPRDIARNAANKVLVVCPKCKADTNVAPWIVEPDGTAFWCAACDAGFKSTGKIVYEKGQRTS